MTLATATGLTLPLGSTPDGIPVTLDLDRNPHTLLTGPCGSGKTVFLRHVVKAGAAAGAKTVVIDPIRNGLGFRNIPVDTVVKGRVEAIFELEGLVAEISRRYYLFQRFNVSRWQDLPEEVRQSETVQPIMVFIDEHAALVAHEPTPRVAGHDELKEEVQEHNDQADLIRKLVGKILRQSRFYGVHLVISDQRADLNSVGPGMRDDLDNLIMTLRPGFTPSEITVAITFGRERAEAALAAAQGATAYGDAVIATPTIGVQRVNLPYSE